MKKLILLIICTFVCGVLFTGCGFISKSLNGKFFKALEENFVGEKIYRISDYPNEYNINKNLITEKWICIDVVASRKSGEYVKLVLQSVEDIKKEKEINAKKVDYRTFKEADIHEVFEIYEKYSGYTYYMVIDVDGYYVTEKGYNKQVDKVRAEVAYKDRIKAEQLAREKAKREEESRREAEKLAREQEKVAMAKKAEEEKLQREKERGEREQQEAEKKAKRKQELIDKYGATTAQKIINGKLEIGMSKAVCREVCKEIDGYATVSNKTATTEIWKVNFYFGFRVTKVIYLHFKNDKLVEIDNWKK